MIYETQLLRVNKNKEKLENYICNFKYGIAKFGLKFFNMHMLIIIEKDIR